MTQVLRGHSIYSPKIVFSPDGRKLASATSDGGILCWNLAEKRIEFELQFPAAKSMVTSLVYTPDGKSLIMGEWSGRILVWDVDPESWKRESVCHRCPELDPRGAGAVSTWSAIPPDVSRDPR